MNKEYSIAQNAIANLKGAIYSLLEKSTEESLSNTEIGKALGIYQGYNGQHEGHMSRTILARMQEEGVVEQDDDTKEWKLVD